MTEEGTDRLIGENAFSVLPIANGFVQYHSPVYLRANWKCGVQYRFHTKLDIH